MSTNADSHLPTQTYVSGKLTKHGTEIVLIGDNQPKHMTRLLIQGAWELWGTRVIRGILDGQVEQWGTPQLFWLVEARVDGTTISGFILEAGLIYPGNINVLQYLLERLNAGNG